MELGKIGTTLLILAQSYLNHRSIYLFSPSPHREILKIKVRLSVEILEGGTPFDNVLVLTIVFFTYFLSFWLKYSTKYTFVAQ